jgi:hypothetical protein
MNPDKLFDYLDGKLSPGDREQLETRLANDSQLLRQLAVARDIHRNMGGSREVIMPSEDPERAGRLGRRIAAAAIVLVFLNVAIGIAVITWKSQKPAANRGQERAVRQQLEESLGAAGRNALPTPSLADDEIELAMPRSGWDRLANSVIAAAQTFGGSAIRDDREDAVIITASVPRSRAGEFRRQVLGPNAAAPPASDISSETATVQVRITQPAR